MSITKETFKSTLRTIMKEESEYQTFFKKALEKSGKSIPSMSDEEKKEFFNKIDSAWNAKGEKNEELTGNQHKLDVDGDGEIEASDLAALRAGEKKDESVNENKYDWRTAIRARRLFSDDEPSAMYLPFSKLHKIFKGKFDSKKFREVLKNELEKRGDTSGFATTKQKNYIRDFAGDLRLNLRDYLGGNIIENVKFYDDVTEEAAKLYKVYLYSLENPSVFDENKSVNEDVALDRLNKVQDARKKMASHIAWKKTNGERKSDSWIDKTEKNLLKKSYKDLEKLYLSLGGKKLTVESVNEEKYPIAVEKFNKELIKHPMVKKAAQFYKKTPAEIVKAIQQRLYSKGDKTGNTKEVWIDFKDTTSGITIKHKMKFNESAGCGCGCGCDGSKMNEGVSPKDMEKIKGAVEAASSFMNIGSELKKTGLRYIFATSPMPVYIVQPTPNNKVAIVNKKYATKPDFVVGDTAVGVMESIKIVNEEKYTVIDPRGNSLGIGLQMQAASMAKKKGGEKAGYFVVPAKNALKARRALEKFKGDFKNPKLKDMMSDLFYENKSVNEVTLRKGTKIRMYFNGNSEIIDYVLEKPNYYNAIKGGKTNLFRVIYSSTPKIKVGSTEDFSTNDLKSKIKYHTASVLVRDSVNEGRAFINAAKKAKAEGKTEFEFNGKTYPVTIKESVTEGKKVFKVNPGIGKVKYSISSHDGVKKHKDGSDFFDIETFKNKVDLEKAIKNYTSKGFQMESVVNEDAGMNKKVKAFLDKGLNDLSKGKPNHQFAVMHILMGALTDANFHSESKKVPSIFSRAKYEGDPMGKKDAIGIYEEMGENVASICKWDGKDIVDAIGFYVSMTIGRPVGEKVEKLVESINETIYLLNNKK